MHNSISLMYNRIGAKYNHIAGGRGFHYYFKIVEGVCNMAD